MQPTQLTFPFNKCTMCVIETDKDILTRLARFYYKITVGYKNIKQYDWQSGAKKNNNNYNSKTLSNKALERSS